MTTKEKVLELFERNKGVFFSGEELAQKISVSRAAVWKAVNALRNEGYSIEAVTNKGYCLSENTDIISVQGIQKYLSKENADLNIEVLQSTGSTNTYIKEKANEVADGYVVVANEQTNGRGRFGRAFYSPAGSGFYLSILLRPSQYTAEKAVRLTTQAAVAMCEAIEEVANVDAKIKWVNDIFVNGRKVCGILTEASFDLESGFLEYAVVGVGLNVYSPDGDFPEELKEIAGCILGDSNTDAKNRLIGSFLNRFLAYYSASNQDEYVKKYRARSFLIGKSITVISGNEQKTAVAYGMDDECHLLVRYEDGQEEALAHGEVSVRDGSFATRSALLS
ncbi:MAG: biotin--[acetyl-CoA-carboxylase] ligase [Agathobacter sp.]|nr:biotin--[acetyl-CoA-carboxylase] ligase [Agathobacter sp.]